MILYTVKSLKYKPLHTIYENNNSHHKYIISPVC
nr:MAG TPA: hypothetical protein [Caudoviricetes sp.]